MKTPNKVLMDKAREALKGKWGMGVKATIVIIVFAMLVSIMLNFLVGVIFNLHGDVHANLRSMIVNLINAIAISGPLQFGVVFFYLSLSRNQETELSQLFIGFHEWARYVIAYLRVFIITLLWTLLLIVPGIIAAYAYSQTFYILADDKSISAKDAMKKSKEMMRGHKWKLFFLGLRFIGWALLCILTIGIGFLWLIPYIRTAEAKFYDDVKNSEPTVEVVAEVATA